MGYHEIDTKQWWKIRCLSCPAVLEASSAGKAEEAAREHIENQDGDNYSHELVITQETRVGRF